MPIGGQWRGGRAGKTGTDSDPWSGDTLTEIPLASAEDLDEAFLVAREAQRGWAAQPPAERAAVMLAAADVMAARKDEITGWLVRESGGTRAKAGLEWNLVRSVMLEAASMPHHATGAIMPSDIPGKESRAYRQPAGVVAVISPWNFPLQLSNRSVAPALACGNGPIVVLDDADLDASVDAAVFGSFFHSGQICMIANRLIVDASVLDGFLTRFTARIQALRAGDPSDPETDIGPVINAKQLSSIQDRVQRAVSAGARPVLAGDPAGPSGLLLPPHVLLGGNDVATAREEVFGPVITVIPAAGEDDALRMANDTPYGLSSAVFTGDLERGTAFALRVEAGMTHVNDSPVNDDANTAFGGVKASGIGRFGGQWAVDEFTTEHWITVQRTPRSFPM